INSSSGNLTMTSCTVAGNSGGGIRNDSALFTLRNTVVAHNTADPGPDVFGSLTSLGHNLIGETDGSTGWVASDRTGTKASPPDPRRRPLQDNGGPTATMALLPGSPALDAGDNSAPPGTDQRGLPRVVGGAIDIGAYEVQAGVTLALSGFPSPAIAGAAGN